MPEGQTQWSGETSICKKLPVRWYQNSVQGYYRKQALESSVPVGPGIKEETWRKVIA